MPIDEIAEAVGGAIIRQVGGFVVELTVEHVFSRHTARFFHGVGRRGLAVITLGLWRIPSSLRVVSLGSSPRPTFGDWFALIFGVLLWTAIAIGAGLLLSHFL